MKNHTEPRGGGVGGVVPRAGTLPGAPSPRPAPPCPAPALGAQPLRVRCPWRLGPPLKPAFQ